MAQWKTFKFLQTARYRTNQLPMNLRIYCKITQLQFEDTKLPDAPFGEDNI